MNFAEKEYALQAAIRARTKWQKAGQAAQNCKDKIDMLRSSRTSPASPKYSGMPKAPAPDDGMGDYFIRLLELEDQERRLLDYVRKKYIKFIVAESKVLKLIGSSKDPEILELRFLLDFSYSRIAGIYEISETSCRRRIRAAVESIEEGDGWQT